MQVIDNLVLEVGRKCNMNCPHCLRGAAEDATLSFEDAKKAIDEVESIGQITFTGGEPFLYSELISKIIDYIMSNKKEVYGFYMATNGSILDFSLLCKFAEFYAYIIDIGGEVEYSCEIDISNDIYHNWIPDKNIDIFKAFRFCNTRGEDMNEECLINEGRAYENGMGHREMDDSYIFDYYEECDSTSMVYVNALGDVLPDCNYSYNTQRIMCPYSIHNFTLSEIVNMANGVTTEELCA